MSEGAKQRHLEYTEKVQSLLADDRRDDAMRLFMRLAGAPEEAIAQAHNSAPGDTRFQVRLPLAAPLLAEEAVEFAD